MRFYLPIDLETSVEHICETCQYYTPNTGGRGCQCPKMIFGYYGRLPVGDEVMLEDDEGWGIHQGPKFGCIHWSTL
jgi:hypothetical protein